MLDAKFQDKNMVSRIVIKHKDDTSAERKVLISYVHSIALVVVVATVELSLGSTWQYQYILHLHLVNENIVTITAPFLCMHFQ